MDSVPTFLAVLQHFIANAKEKEKEQKMKLRCLQFSTHA